ncbi:Membrane-associated transporter protein [Trichoplax sp. H2]|nr:Membrane-associated transporter protein [Trichoplax sp. H2]|eukprot:RDD40114.1 Membrane-associated transporter protein [Trichoplax sp. H2]
MEDPNLFQYTRPESNHRHDSESKKKTIGHDGIMERSHVFQPINKQQVAAASCSFAAIEIGYAAQSIYEVPILSSSGLPRKYVPFLWCAMPILALIIQPYLAIKSDRCYCSWGRRRPFMLAFMIGMLIGLILLGYGKTLGFLIDHQSQQSTTAIAFTIMGIWFMDYFADALQVPSKALILDYSKDHAQTANNIATAVSCLGTIVGYGICSLNWKNTFLTNLFATEIEAVFTIAATAACILFIVALLCCKEKVLYKPNRPKLIHREEDTMLRHSIKIGSKAINGMLFGSKSEAISRNYIVMMEKDRHKNIQWKKMVSCCNFYFYGIIKLPHELVILCIVSSFGWIAHIGFIFFFSDYMGQYVFKGNSNSAFNSSSYIAYRDGVKISSLALICSNFMGIIYIFILERWLLKCIGSRMSMILGFTISCTAMIIISSVDSIEIIFCSCCAIDIATVSLHSIPYGLIGKYHHYYKEDPRWKARGYGTDSSVLNNCMYLGTLLISVTFGFIIENSDSMQSVIFAAGLSNFIAAVISIFIIDPETISSTRNITI